MIKAGLLREVRALRERGYGADLRPMQGIGYRHMQPVVDGADTLVNALEGIKIDTRRFARRQRTWLRSVADVHWHDPTEVDSISKRVEAFLAKPDSRRLDSSGDSSCEEGPVEPIAAGEDARPDRDPKSTTLL